MSRNWKREGSPAAVADLQRQLDHLASLEDPANTTRDAVVYREMLDEVALVGHREPERSYGESSSTHDARKGRGHRAKVAAEPEPESVAL